MDRGAGFDVLVRSPPRGGIPSNLDNVVVTPHLAGVTRNSNEEDGALGCESTARVLRGESRLRVNHEVLKVRG